MGFKTSLDFPAIRNSFSGVDAQAPIRFNRVRPHNGGEIRRPCVLPLKALLREIETSIVEQRIAGGDLEIPLPRGRGLLVGHHDGIYWIERPGETPRGSS